MATRTISNTGGNYNATGTWVEGIVPTSADAVVATATSGNLTVNVTSAAASMNFTNYIRTLTVSAVLSVTGNMTFVTAMTLAGTSTIQMTSTGSLNTNGKTININLNFTVGTRTLLSDLTTTANLTFGSMTLNGFNVYSSGTTTYGSSTGTTIINIKGGTVTATVAATNLTNACNRIVLDSGANTIFLNNNYIAVSGPIKYVSGNIAGIVTSHVRNMYLESHASAITSTKVNLDVAGITWSNVTLMDQQGVTTSIYTVNLESNLNVSGSVIVYKNTNTEVYPRVTNTFISFGGTGSGVINAATLYVNTEDQWVAGGITYNKPIPLANSTIILRSGFTHSFGELYLYGHTTTLQPLRSRIQSSIPGTKAAISISGTSSSIYWDWVDIDANLNPVYALYGPSTSGSTGVTYLSSPAGMGGSWTFAN